MQVYHSLLPVCFWFALFSFWQHDNQNVWMVMIISGKILNEWMSAPQAQKGEMLRFDFIQVQSHKTQLKREPLKLSDILFNSQWAINIICAVVITTPLL